MSLVNKRIRLNQIDSLIRFFLYVLAFFLPYGPAVVESCVISAFILFLIKRTISRNWSFPSNECHIPILLYIGACILASLFSINPLQSLGDFVTKPFEWFVVYYLVLESFKSRKDIRVLVRVLIVTSTITALDSFIQYHITSVDVIMKNVIVPKSRATAGFKNANTLAAYWTVLIPIALAQILAKAEKNSMKILYILAFLLMIWSIIITFSDGGLLGAFFGCALFIVLYGVKKRIAKENQHKIISTGIFIAFAAFLLVSVVMISKVKFIPVNMSWRFNVWRDSLQMFADRPLIGHGINNFMEIFQYYRILYDTGFGPTYAHNSFVQIACETGILGLLFFFSIIYVIIYQSIKLSWVNVENNEGVNNLVLGLMCGILAFFVHSFFDNNLYSLQLSVYIWFAIGILSSLIVNIQSSKKESKL